MASPPVPTSTAHRTDRSSPASQRASRRLLLLVLELGILVDPTARPDQRFLELGDTMRDRRPPALCTPATAIRFIAHPVDLPVLHPVTKASTYETRGVTAASNSGPFGRRSLSRARNPAPAQPVAARHVLRLLTISTEASNSHRVEIHHHRPRNPTGHDRGSCPESMPCPRPHRAHKGTEDNPR